ncbi:MULTISPECIES: Scr1 family TA system antitoxin-like transcriptional regulator [Streptomyces]|uniref:Scr1 family TA system antitoxin-like transcriptional regulator n=3 Tax=Streptomyces TaxID=1883 RepID=A0ABD5JM86_9ACTN|nr:MULTISPECIES: Scr1 family TA system antitoxin-like transcriptional regulator [Streptomyces]KUL49807.1 DNA-binding protein [Streptomyces violaceusniger]MEE4589381.1 Scr1 family TA system antitoxin-like transcriptional regulator [Streptomyces sp. DSM 41602]QTI88577.1 helix-turn-helix domain-containing protein [Streptomyces sp. AgN23]
MPRTAPTARQRRLGTELRKMREHAGMNVAQAAQQLGVDRTRISNTEAGRFGVSEERVRALAAIYSCGDTAYIDALVDMALERVQGWWEEYHGKLPAGALDLAELEHHAVSLRSMQPMHIPGLLQTEDYAKAVFSTAVPDLTAVELRRRLSHRLRRRDVLDRDDAPECTFLVHEAALRMQFGGAKVARGQLGHLLEASERDNVAVRVIPFSAGGFPGAGASVLYAAGPVPQLDTVQLDVATGVALVDAETLVTNYWQVLERTQGLSLSPEDTRDFVRAIAEQL